LLLVLSANAALALEACVTRVTEIAPGGYQQLKNSCQFDAEVKYCESGSSSAGTKTIPMGKTIPVAVTKGIKFEFDYCDAEQSKALKTLGWDKDANEGQPGGTPRTFSAVATCLKARP
jgi:hypothetical protein